MIHFSSTLSPSTFSVFSSLVRTGCCWRKDTVLKEAPCNTGCFKHRINSCRIMNKINTFRHHDAGAIGFHCIKEDRHLEGSKEIHMLLFNLAFRRHLFLQSPLHGVPRPRGLKSHFCFSAFITQLITAGFKEPQLRSMCLITTIATETIMLIMMTIYYKY